MASRDGTAGAGPSEPFRLLKPDEHVAAPETTGASDLLAAANARAIANYMQGATTWFEQNRTINRYLKPLQAELSKELPRGVQLDIELRRGRGCDLAPLATSTHTAPRTDLDIFDRSQLVAAFSFRPGSLVLTEEEKGEPP